MKISLIVVSLLLLVSCSTSKDSKKQTPSGNTFKEELVLNGTSDDNHAGGLRTVHFDFLSDSLNERTKAPLEHNKLFLENNSKIYVQIEGHCDDRGSSQYNLALGERRAKAVRDYLRAKGIASRRMTIISLGKEKPLMDGDSDEARSKNRRANFVITSM